MTQKVFSGFSRRNLVHVCSGWSLFFFILTEYFLPVWKFRPEKIFPCFTRKIDYSTTKLSIDSLSRTIHKYSCLTNFQWILSLVTVILSRKIITSWDMCLTTFPFKKSLYTVIQLYDSLGNRFFDVRCTSSSIS